MLIWNWKLTCLDFQIFKIHQELAELHKWYQSALIPWLFEGLPIFGGLFFNIMAPAQKLGALKSNFQSINALQKPLLQKKVWLDLTRFHLSPLHQGLLCRLETLDLGRLRASVLLKAKKALYQPKSCHQIQIWNTISSCLNFGIFPIHSQMTKLHLQYISRTFRIQIHWLLTLHFRSSNWDCRPPRSVLKQRLYPEPYMHHPEWTHSPALHHLDSQQQGNQLS